MIDERFVTMVGSGVIPSTACVILVDTNGLPSGAVVVVLPMINSVNNGKTIIIKRFGPRTVNVIPSIGNILDTGVNQFSLGSSGAAITLISNQNTWWRVASVT